jgi:hypothetical protein
VGESDQLRNKRRTPLIEDHRARKDGICGVTFTDVSGREWICVKQVHAKVYQRHNPRPGENPMKFSEYGADNHYMVVRWPNREKAS